MPKKCTKCRSKIPEGEGVSGGLRSFCDLVCLFAWTNSQAGQKKIKAQERRETRKQKLAAKPRAKWLEEAQTVFNKWVRLRDKDLKCVSCGVAKTVQWHAGHYRPVGGYPHLRFDENNVHKQCSRCNDRLSGNLQAYREVLIGRIGIEEVERLESDRTGDIWRIDEIRKIKADYTKRIKDILSKEV